MKMSEASCMYRLGEACRKRLLILQNDSPHCSAFDREFQRSTQVVSAIGLGAAARGFQALLRPGVPLKQKLQGALLGFQIRRACT